MLSIHSLLEYPTKWKSELKEIESQCKLLNGGEPMIQERKKSFQVNKE